MGTVSTAAIAAMVVDMILGFAIPVVLCIVLKKKTGGSLKSFFVGCGVFFVFAYILESLFHNIILGGPGAAIKDNIWLYGLYGGFMAGLFEETGRFIAFKTILRKDRDNNNNALMYGAGHGGLEALLIMGLTMINNIIYSIMINSGQTEMLLE